MLVNLFVIYCYLFKSFTSICSNSLNTFFIFFKKFQLIVSVHDNNFLSSNQNTNRFLRQVKNPLNTIVGFAAHVASKHERMRMLLLLMAHMVTFIYVNYGPSDLCRHRRGVK